MSKLKDARLDEKEVVVIHGAVMADEFRDRLTGKLLGGGGDDGAEVNIINFSIVSLDNEGKATLTPTAEQWAKMADATEECIVIVTQSNGVKYTLSRTHIDTSRIIFASQHSTTETLEDATATFVHIDGDGYYTGGIVVDTMLEANGVLDEHTEYADLHNITVNGETYLIPQGSGDSDVVVSISTDEGSTWDEPITLKEFISNCEVGNVYSVGTQATILNCFGDGKDYRFVLVGVNADVLASDDTTVVKTTWNFLDMPVHQARLGLPFNVIDWGSNMGRAFANAYLDGTNESALTWYPSSRGGYITAIGLLNVLHVIYEGLPPELKRAIKTVRKAFNIPRQTRSIAANGGTESDSSGIGYIAQKLFLLSATESGSTSYGIEGTAYPYLNSNERRIRYYNGVAAAYWLRTPYPSTSHYWDSVNADGNITSDGTNNNRGVAPAFCI